MDFYRFSISWPRVLPTGDVSNINNKSINYYNRLIDTCLAYGIQPMVTMYHYDMPEELQKFGGLTNDIIIDYFGSYANLLFKRFGDRVKFWITFNEPSNTCLLSYGTGEFAPRVKSNGIGELLCGSNILKAHARAYRIYKDRYAARFRGKVGITLNSRYFYSATNSTSDVERAMQFYVRRLYSWNQFLVWITSEFFSSDGLHNRFSVDTATIQKLWKLKSEETAFAKDANSRDCRYCPMIGSRIYEVRPTSWDSTTIRVAWSSAVSTRMNRTHRLCATQVWSSARIQHGSNRSHRGCIRYPTALASWCCTFPLSHCGRGAYFNLPIHIRRYIQREYGNPEVIITENGWPDGGRANDTDRIIYFADHLKEILKVIRTNGCNVTGYTGN